MGYSSHLQITIAICEVDQRVERLFEHVPTFLYYREYSFLCKKDSVNQTYFNFFKKHTDSYHVYFNKGEQVFARFSTCT